MKINDQWKVTKLTETRERYETKTKSGNKFIIEIITCKHDKKDKNNIMNLWIRNNCIKNFIEESLHVQTYYYDNNNNCWGRYNIQIKENYKINFEYILENTKENKTLLINKCLELANK